MTLDIVEGSGSSFFQNSVLRNAVVPFFLKAKEDTHVVKVDRNALLLLKDRFPNMDQKIESFLT